MTHRDRESRASADAWAARNLSELQDRCCDDRYDAAYTILSATQPVKTNTMQVHQLRNVITQAPNGAPVIIRTASPGGINHTPRELIHAEYGHVPSEHLTLIVAPELVATAAPAPSTPFPHPTAVRAIHTHKVNPVNDLVELEVIDGQGAGGAHHYYRMTVPGQEPIYLGFQTGPIAANGVNGITQEILLAIVIDRLECFQAGPFACKDNEDALAMIKGGLTCLQKRTRLRMAQKVEGLNVQHVETPAPTLSAPVDSAPAPSATAKVVDEQPAPSVAETISEPVLTAADVQAPVPSAEVVPDGAGGSTTVVSDPTPQVEAADPDLTRPPGE